MSDFALAHAADQPADALVARCTADLGDVSSHTMGFVYATSPLEGEYESIVTGLRRQTGIASWYGTVGLGVCATGAEYFDRPAMVCMTARADPRTCHPIRSISELESIAGAIPATVMAPVGVVHGDPRNPKAVQLISGIADRSGAYLVGGMTSAEGNYPQAAGERISDTGISGILMGGKGLDPIVGLTQGCSPIGPAHTITAVEDRVLVTLDQEPAYEVLQRDAGASQSDDPRRWLANIHVAIPVPGSDRADYVVRNLIGIGPEQGLVAIAEALEPGDRVMFVRRDPASAARDLDRMLGELKARVKGQPKAGLYFSCLARGPNLFREEAHELKAIQRTFGNIPIAGFFGNGEIAHNRLYGYTGVLTLFA